MFCSLLRKLSSKIKTFLNNFDYLSETDEDDILEDMQGSAGGIWGVCSGIGWDLRRPKRSKFLVWTCVLIILFGSVLVFSPSMIKRSVNFDIGYTCQVSMLINFTAFPFAAILNNIAKRRSLTSLFEIIKYGFIYYGDFPICDESVNWSLVTKYLTIIKRVMVTLILILGLVPVYLFMDNQKRESLPEWLDSRLPLPFWLPLDTSSTYFFVFALFLEVCLLVSFISCVYGQAICVSKLCLTVGSEIRITIEAIRQLEQRALTTYREFMKSQNSSWDGYIVDASQLHEDRMFSCIFKTCFKKVIIHHQNIIRFIRLFNDYYTLHITFAEYTSGVYLAFTVYLILDEKSSLNLRILMLFALMVFYGFNCYMCIICQKISDSISDLHREVYMTQWIDADESFKKLIKIFQIKAFHYEEVKSTLLETRINHDFIVKVTKACYSMINFICIMRRQTPI